MKQVLLYSFLIVIVSCAFTCGHKISSLEAGDYVSWIENASNGMVVTKKLNNLTFELQYKPLDYIILEDNDGKTFSAKQMREKRNEIKDMQYFTFRISDDKEGDLLKDEAHSVEDFSARLAYFSDGMQKDLKLIEDNDTLHCLLFHFERTYGIDPRSTFVLGFPLSKKDGSGGSPASFDKNFLFDDHSLGCGSVYIIISADKINQAPALKLN